MFLLPGSSLSETALGEGRQPHRKAGSIYLVPTPCIHPEAVVLVSFRLTLPLSTEGGWQIMGKSRCWSVTQAMNGRQALPPIHALESGEFSPKKVTCTPPIVPDPLYLLGGSLSLT